MATQVQQRRGTTAEHSTFTGAVGEVTIDTDKDTAVVHDGSTAGGRPLLREDLSNLPAGAIDNADINASAAIAGTKISPDFGSQNVTTTGTSTAASFIPTSSTVPTNGVYLPAANSVALSTNGTGRLFVDASGNVGIGTALPSAALDVSVGFIDNNRFNAPGAVRLNRAQGTASSPVAITSPVLCGAVQGRGYDGTTHRTVSSITFETEGAVTSTSSPGYVALNTTPSGATIASERLRITSAGLVGIGTSSPSRLLTVTSSTNGESQKIAIENTWNHNSTTVANYKDTLEFRADKENRYTAAGAIIGPLASVGCVYATTTFASDADQGGGALVFNTRARTSSTASDTLTERLRIDDQGRVGIGTTSPGSTLDVNGTIRSANYHILDGSTSAAGVVGFSTSNGPALEFWGSAAAGGGSLIAKTAGSERARIDSSGRLLVGTSSTSVFTTAVLQGNSAVGTSNGIIKLARGESTPANQAFLGEVAFSDSGHVVSSRIVAVRDAGTWTSGSSQPSALLFSTTADGASSPTERMRITNAGSVLVGKTVDNTTDIGTVIGPDGYGYFVRGSNVPLVINRLTTDGTLVSLRQDSTEEGTISVSGTTVSYNGAHLSRWSQLPSGQERTEILRGTILSNIDEMCEWGDEDNEQLNRMKVSDVEGDKNVSGVFQAWDDDDDTYTNDFYCAMTGDFIIRIAQGVTVERGDLLMSAGDGTAKPQDDDIIRSKTIAKVTSTNVSCTYDDGSYCVPCVLMAC